MCLCISLYIYTFESMYDPQSDKKIQLNCLLLAYDSKELTERKNIKLSMENILYKNTHTFYTQNILNKNRFIYFHLFYIFNNKSSVTSIYSTQCSFTWQWNWSCHCLPINFKSIVWWFVVHIFYYVHYYYNQLLNLATIIYSK